MPEEAKNKLITKESVAIEDLIKKPIVIKNNNKYEIVSEKILQKLILENMLSKEHELV